jgi:hypothetical protein
MHVEAFFYFLRKVWHCDNAVLLVKYILDLCNELYELHICC